MMEMLTEEKGQKTCPYLKYPYIETRGEIWTGWAHVLERIEHACDSRRFVLVVDAYSGVFHGEILDELARKWPESRILDVSTLYKDNAKILQMTRSYMTDDEIFGRLSPFGIEDYFDPEKLADTRSFLASHTSSVILYGPGALYVAQKADLVVYADMARWEIQQRMRGHKVHGLGVGDGGERPSRQYKRGYFNDWPLLDKYKKSIYQRVDFWLDTHAPGHPKMISHKTFMTGIEKAAHAPFRVVPFFDPAPWGGQWMKEVCDLDRNRENFGWCFDCVPEENSLLLKVGAKLFEMPSVNLVYLKPQEVLGEKVAKRFGDNFPIRFDFLDTMDGGNLSLQVHPTTEYARKTFGIPYTQDESYYLMDAIEGAYVFLATKNGANREAMIRELREAQDKGVRFDTDKYINAFPAKKHDHFLIPAGTIHCSGAGSMVLEISATPNLFTFKMWDWDRMGLDGRPRPINIEHAANVIDWSRDTDFAERELCNRIECVASGDGWVEEKTGLHDLEFIETRRHWFTKPVEHDTHGGVNVLNLVEGDCAVVESPEGAFEPFEVHYAETFIVPAAVGKYTIRPHERSNSERFATIKAYVRT